jgi:hypothetical protein
MGLFMILSAQMWPGRSFLINTAILACVAACAADAQEPVLHSIRIVSEPPGADVCEIIDSKTIFLGRTPIDLPIEFRSIVSSKRLYLTRIGYETAKFIVKPSDNYIYKPLIIRKILLDIPKDVKLPEREVRILCNESIQSLFFSNYPPNGIRGFEFVGKLSINPTEEGRFTITVPIIVEDQFRAKEIAAIERDIQPNERTYAIANSLWRCYVGALASTINTAIGVDPRIKQIVFIVNYSRTKFSLVDDDDTFIFTQRSIVSSRQEVSGTHVRQVNEYKVWSVNLPSGYQNLVAAKRVYTSVFIVPAGSAPANDQIVMMSNDNRLGEMVALAPSRLEGPSIHPPAR